jgi:hypothetical protein
MTKIDYAIAVKRADDLERTTREELDRLGDRVRGASLPPVQAVLHELSGWAAALMSADVAAQRDVLAELVERIIPIRKSRGEYPAEIHWTPLGRAIQQSE